MRIREYQGFRAARPHSRRRLVFNFYSEGCVHTIVAVLTDDGRRGWGSVFTSESLVRASLAVLQPLYRDESAIEPERVSEKLHRNAFWAGARRIDHAHR